MGLYEKLVNGEEKLSLVGLGYVGMPIAVAFGRKINVIGYDLNAQKVEQYKAGYDTDQFKRCLEDFFIPHLQLFDKRQQ